MKTIFFNYQKPFCKIKIIVVFTACMWLLNINQSISQLSLNKQHDTYSASSVTNSSIAALNLNTVATSIKVERSFISYFGEAAENNCSIAGKYFLNCFNVNGLLTYAWFTKNGKLINVTTYGTEKDLPADVRKIIKSEYYDYKIATAIDVKENNRDIWVVQLDNASEQLTVKVEDGEMEEVLTTLNQHN
jgi:hypothetical protein